MLELPEQKLCVAHSAGTTVCSVDVLVPGVVGGPMCHEMAYDRSARRKVVLLVLGPGGGGVPGLTGLFVLHLA